MKTLKELAGEKWPKKVKTNTSSLMVNTQRRGENLAIKYIEDIQVDVRDFVEVCEKCEGTGNLYDGKQGRYICPDCEGRGIVEVEK